MKTTKGFGLLFILFFSLISNTHAQEQVKDEYGSVMIIPFDPNLYFSDSDEQLSKYNQKSIKEIRTMFRYGLNINVNAKILSQYETRPLLTDTIKGAHEDLNLIYRDIGYFKDMSMPSKDSKEKTLTDQNEKKKILTLKKKDEESEAQTTSKLKEPEPSQEYINVRINQPEMLQYLKKKYGTGLFVFINQFELVTNFEHCLDRATNTFERDVKVHFSIFDYTGKQLAGNVAIAHFSSNSNDLMEIIRDNFPIISEYLAGNLPKKVKAAPTETGKPAEKKEETMEFEKN